MTASPETASVAHAQGRRLPDFFIVGHAKSGTTALYEMLRRHPQIFMPELKEPMFFARNPGAGTRFEQTGNRTETLEQYLALFAGAGAEQLAGEASTFYLWSALAPPRIAQLQPDARIIAILREPASFLHSLHLQAVQNGAETERDLRKALALEDARRRGREIPAAAHWPAALIYSDRVRYVEQLRRYGELFAPEQMLVLIYDDFSSDNEATIRRVLRFLGVDDGVPLELVRANRSVAVRSVRLDRIVRALRGGRGPLSGALRKTVRGVTTQESRTRLLHPLRGRMLYGAPKPSDEELVRELRIRFRPEVLALGDYLGRDLASLWGYDDLD
ncbi:MAG TPA: sulfotransferase [Solirubrobacteraceae bacterium]|nr:sulfotransferase [Solirubrobacteraceae bacterium]